MFRHPVRVFRPANGFPGFFCLIPARVLEILRISCYLICGFLSTANPGRVSGPKKHRLFRP
jgi:hypothetical protein